MANFNKVLLMGNLTRDPQLSYLPSQTAVVDFGLAVNRRWTGKDGQTKEEVCFVDCRAFGKPAETINKYLSKGRAVFVEGRLTLDSWTAQDGSKRNKHRVTVENFQFLPAARTSDTGDKQETADDSPGRSLPEQGERRPAEEVETPGADDIPF